jgi:hypothetical protein
MRKEKTRPAIQEALLRSLRRWRRGKDPTQITTTQEVHQALVVQQQIGWQDMLEGLLARDWRRLQHDYYHQIKSRKSSLKWASGISQQLIKLGIRQWKHRNEYKHRIGKTVDKEYAATLDKAIIRELVLGPNTLLPGDKHKVKVNMIRLLQKPLKIRKAWWIHVHTARQRYMQIQQQRDDLIRESRESSTLYQWFLRYKR